MTDDQVRQITLAIDRQTLSITAAILMSGWVPDDPSRLVQNDRCAKAIHTARGIFHDAISTAIAKALV